MATETQAPQPPPEITIISRVASIPIVSSSLDVFHSTLSTNPYTRTPYAYAEGFSKAALGYTEPIQKRLAPIIVRADGFANKGLDKVEQLYPYPFKTPPETIIEDIKGTTTHAYDVANKTIDEKVKSPALNVAQGIDQRFAPVVDYFEQRIHSNAASPTEGAPAEQPQYQFQRAFLLSKELGDQIYSYSAEQVNQIKTQNALVQRATEAAQKVNAIASTSYGAAQEKIHGVSDVMLQELQKVQTSTANLPAAVQASFNDISTHLSSAIHDVSAILTSPDPLPDKAHKLRETVQDRVQPILDASAARVQQILDSIRGKAAEEAQEVTSNGNGHAT
ncbi:lipid droplet-associated perilipin protein [Abortiporus biennis]|nr:lipid droplet-associated perilipin protein [Abortiporus biennis]KAI0786314.1 lipid droplet-associated perilipin protein [Abortiporus biennis]